jgi:hypothetical protein
MHIYIFFRQTGIAHTYCYSPTASCWHLCYLIPPFFFEVITLHTPNCFWSLSTHYKKYLIIKKQKILAKDSGKYLWFHVQVLICMMTQLSTACTSSQNQLHSHVVQHSTNFHCIQLLQKLQILNCRKHTAIWSQTKVN